MIVAILLAVVFGYVGLNMFARWQEHVMLKSLDEDARQTKRAIDAGQQAPEVIALYRKTAMISRTIDQEQDRLLVLLALLACLLGIVVGFALAARLTRPIEAVCVAARRIATGDLRSRARARIPGAGELSQLLEDFNAMADALEAFERHVREGSAAIAHELRTPLTILRGRLQGWFDGVFSPDEAELRGLIEQVDLLTRIVEDLHMLGMASTGRLDLQCEPIDLAELAAIQVDAAVLFLGEAGVNVERHLACALVEADRQRIAQVVTVLLDNVRRHAAAGNDIEVETGSDDDKAWLCVSHHGPGLPSDPERMFEPFWRSEPSRSREHGGSGLGLAVAAAHGGALVAMDRPGGGAVFTLNRPREGSESRTTMDSKNKKACDSRSLRASQSREIITKSSCI
jgi:two-component system sensor histidine kinase BaeS/two-component system sensor histidine kinase AdeS